MRPDERDLDEEIRGHLAISIKERIDQGEDPEAARLAALRELGYVPAIREEMRRVWYGRWFDALVALGQEMRIGLRSLRRARGLAATVIITLALGIGANAAIFSVVRGVLLRPLVNRDEERLVYIRQRAPGLAAENMTFSMPEVNDLRSGAKTIAAFGDFSTVDFTLAGLGRAPHVVKAGVVSGSYFEVMGLRPELGRLLNASDDGTDAAAVAVLTNRYWRETLDADPAVVGRKIRLGLREATVIGVLEPSVPYPAATEIIANVVSSPHHLGATMVGERTHRMTELFGRLARGATVETARDELVQLHASMMRAHPEAYAANARVELRVTPLRTQIASPARTILLLLLAAAGIVFVIACSNVANLILARSVRREGELAVRAALGASPGALRRTLLAESLVLCGAGAALGVLIATPFLALVSRFAARFSVRALEVTVDAGLLWVGAGLALAAAVALAYVPRLPSTDGPAGPLPAGRGSAGWGPAGWGPAGSGSGTFSPSGGSLRLAPGTNGRLRLFAMTQIACSFVLIAAAGMLLASLAALQRAHTGVNLRQVLAIDVPLPIESTGAASIAFFEEATRRVTALPGVSGAAAGTFVPWRDAGMLGPGFRFTVEGRTRASVQEDPHARLRNVTPGFFDVLGIPRLAGRDFTADDRKDTDPVVIVSDSLARQMFPAGDALNHHLWWTDPYFGRPIPRRIIGIVADVEDEHVAIGPALTIYHPLRQMPYGGRLFVRTDGDPYALVPDVTRVIHELSAEQPVERAATLEDVRADVLTPDRLNAFIVAGFAGVALLIAMVGVAGVLAFSVSARTHEFGVRLAVGSTPRRLLLRILSEGLVIVTIGIAAGAAGGYALSAVASRYVESMHMPGVLPIVGAAVLLGAAALVASWLPAARAARVDVLQALRSE